MLGVYPERDKKKEKKERPEVWGIENAMDAVNE